MRLVHFDDAGLFNAKQEPFIVIGGCFINPDTQLIPLEKEFERLLEKHIPIEDRGDFIFHATERWKVLSTRCLAERKAVGDSPRFSRSTEEI